MLDSDPVIAPLGGRAVTPELIDAARRHLVMLRSLHEEVRLTVPTLCPPGSGTWRSAAADRYVEGLEYLRSRLIGALLRLEDAEAALDDRIRRMQARLDVQQASTPGGR
ncbi:hypothetical protein [Agromyces bauzanensis]